MTEFGGTLTYLAIFFIIFWGIDKNFGKSLFSIYVFGSAANYCAKSIISNARPPESEWILKMGVLSIIQIGLLEQLSDFIYFGLILMVIGVIILSAVNLVDKSKSK